MLVAGLVRFAGLLVARVALLVIAGLLLAGLVVALVAVLLIAVLLVAGLLVAVLRLLVARLGRRVRKAIAIGVVIGVTLPLIRSVGLALLRLIALLIAAFIRLALQFAVRLAQHPCVMFGMLQKVFIGDAVIAQLRIAGQELIFFNDLLRRTAHFALGARTIKHTVDDITQCAGAVRFRTRTLFG